MFEDDGLFTPCHSDMEGTEGVNVFFFSTNTLFSNVIEFISYKKIHHPILRLISLEGNAESNQRMLLKP